MDLTITSLGPAKHPCPLRDSGSLLIDDAERILLGSTAAALDASNDPPAFERAGPRAKLFFEPGQVTAGIVTCGGLCPGLNNVIRSVVHTLHHHYGALRILGFRYGYAGLSDGRPAEPLELTPDLVESIHEQGGTILGSSRGPQDLGEMATNLERWGVDLLFTIGGDGTLRGASALSAELARRGRPTAVVGIPKTIDNDLLWVERSFGFVTAVEEASQAILAAHAEARGAWNGVGLVKLMGRHAGFITAHATLASSDVNFCLVPEVPFTFDGFARALEDRLSARHHAVVVVAEGADQQLVDSEDNAHDASGNRRLADVGVALRDRLKAHFAQREFPMTLKYIDPSYTIRSRPAGSFDAAFCLELGQHAVHAAMAGKTDCMVGFWNRHFTHVPLHVATERRRCIDPNRALWSRVLEATGQPAEML